MSRTWSDAQLDGFRKVGDPPADALAGAVLGRGRAEVASAAWDVLRRTDDPLPEGLPPDMAAFLQAHDALPEWADSKKIRRAEAFFAQHGPAVVTGLLCASLPTAYSCARGAGVLGETGRMQSDLRARIDETAQLVFDVAAPGGLEPGGRGVRTLEKVRLVHAAVRTLILGSGTWNVARAGVPINQEDLAGTLLTFGYVTARAVEQLGATVDLEEWEAWLHVWRIAGHQLGLDDALLPLDHAEARALYHAIMRRQQAPSAIGRDLTRALVDHIAAYIPGRMYDGIAAELMRHFVGDRVADWLGVPRRNWTAVLLWVERRWSHSIDTVLDDSRLLRFGAGRFNVALLEAMATADRHGKEVRFRIPDSLRPQ